MKRLITISTIFILLFTGCKKDDEPTGPNLPEGATPYTEADIQFVPYTSSSPVYKTLPDLDSQLTLNFIERIRTEEYFAWDQTYFSYSNDPNLELELRLRYLQTDNSQKTLAMYFPYQDELGTYRENIFETPISSTNISSGFFQDIVTFHDTISLGGSLFYKVYEIKELVSTDIDKDGPENYARIFYNKNYGIIQMKQRNGTIWMLQF